MYQQIVRFFQEAYHELKLSTWLTRQQMFASTIVVISLTVVVAIYVGLIDWVLLKAVGLFFRIG